MYQQSHLQIQQDRVLLLVGEFLLFSILVFLLRIQIASELHFWSPPMVTSSYYRPLPCLPKRVEDYHLDLQTPMSNKHDSSRWKCFDRRSTQAWNACRGRFWSMI